jgi:hypothetical protein
MRLIALAALCTACASAPTKPIPATMPGAYEVTLACSCPISWYCSSDSCLCTINTTGTVVNSVMMRCGHKPDWFFPKDSTGVPNGSSK